MLELKHARKAYGDLVVFNDLNLHIERGDRIALVGPNGAGKSTLMRMLSGEEAPDAGERIDGHNVVMQYFAQDEATRHGSGADRVRDAGVRIAACTWCRRSATSSAASCSPATTSTSTVRVLSGGERTRLAVARMLLRPSNTLLLDEPTNHLDLDSKEVLLDALVDYGGTLIFVSHDRYFVERLATKIIEVGNGTARRLSRAPTRSSCGTRSIREAAGATQARRRQDGATGATAKRRKTRRAARDRPARRAQPPKAARSRRTPQPSHEEKKRVDAEARKQQRADAGAPGAHRRRSRRGSPRPKPRSGSSKQRWPPRASTTTAPPPSRSSTATRR